MTGEQSIKILKNIVKNTFGAIGLVGAVLGAVFGFASGTMGIDTMSGFLYLSLIIMVVPFVLSGGKLIEAVKLAVFVIVLVVMLANFISSMLLSPSVSIIAGIAVSVAAGVASSAALFGTGSVRISIARLFGIIVAVMGILGSILASHEEVDINEVINYNVLIITVISALIGAVCASIFNTVLKSSSEQNIQQVSVKK